MRYFMSYVSRPLIRGVVGEHHFGCTTTDGDEHPITKVARWNAAYPERLTVLLFYRELSPEEAALEIDRET